MILRPGLVCRRKKAICDITGYVVYDGEKAIASAATAVEAWWKAYLKIKLEAKGKK